MDEQKTEEFLAGQTHMVLAVTLEDGSPWAVPLKIQRRDGLRTFEWDSRTDAVHSHPLLETLQAAVTVFRASADEWEAFGYCAQGKVEITERRGDDYARYRFTADRAWINDEWHQKRELALEKRSQ